MVVNKIIGSLVDKRTINSRPVINHNGICYLCCDKVAPGGLLLCGGCRSGLPVIEGGCFACALPGPAGNLCARCLRRKKPLIHRTVCPFLYTYPVNKLIQDMKFHSRPEIVNIFAAALTDKITSEEIDLPQCLVPAPLHGSRLRQRGYNQSTVLAHLLSERLGLPVTKNGLFRIRKTKTQSELPAPLRKRNVKNAFAANLKVMPSFNHVAIVDDVITTGATAQEMARAIKQAGVERIDIWVCARPAI